MAFELVELKSFDSHYNICHIFSYLVLLILAASQSNDFSFFYFYSGPVENIIRVHCFLDGKYNKTLYRVDPRTEGVWNASNNSRDLLRRYNNFSQILGQLQSCAFAGWNCGKPRGKNQQQLQRGWQLSRNIRAYTLLGQLRDPGEHPRLSTEAPERSHPRAGGMPRRKGKDK